MLCVTQNARNDSKTMRVASLIALVYLPATLIAVSLFFFPEAIISVDSIGTLNRLNFFVHTFFLSNRPSLAATLCNLRQRARALDPSLFAGSACSWGSRGVSRSLRSWLHTYGAVRGKRSCTSYDQLGQRFDISVTSVTACYVSSLIYRHSLSSFCMPDFLDRERECPTSASNDS